MPTKQRKIKKKLLLAALTVAGFLALGIFSIIIYIRSGRLDLFVKNKIVEELKDAGIDAKIGNVGLDLRGYRVIIEDLSLSTFDDSKPFATVDKIIIDFSVIAYLKQKISISNISVIHPVIRFDIDRQGRTFLDSLQAPEKKPPSGESNVSIFTSDFSIEAAEIHFTDEKDNITCEFPEISATLTNNERTGSRDILNHKLKLSLNKGAGAYQGKPVKDLSCNLEGDVTNSGITISSLKIYSNLGESAASGNISSFTPFTYDFQIRTKANAGEIAGVFAPNINVRGTAVLDGRVTGANLDYTFSGGLTSDTMTVEGIHIAGFKMRSDIQGKGTSYQARTDIRTSSISGFDTASSGTGLDLTVNGDALNFKILGTISLGSAKHGLIGISGVRALIDADTKHVTLSSMTASVLGGSVTGSLSLGYSGGESQVDVSFKSIDLSQAAALASARDIKVTGALDGYARFKFPGLEFKRASGNTEAKFEASIARTQEGSESATAKGEFSVIVDNGAFKLENVNIRSYNSTLNASGTLDLAGNGSLAVDFKSEEMGELMRAVDAFGFIPENVKSYELSLVGPGRFTGRVEGSLSLPRVSGNISLAGIELHGEQLGSLAGDIAFTGDEIRVQNGSLSRSDGSNASFDLFLPLNVENGISVNAEVKDLDLPSIIRAIEPYYADIINRGVLNGQINLKGLPSPNTIIGTADVTLTAGEFKLPPREGEEEERRISIPQFSGKITKINNLIQVDSLRMQISDSLIVGSGSYNLDTYAFSVNAEGKNINLSQIGGALSDNIHISGLADVTINGKGYKDNLALTNLTTQIHGHNVTLEGRSLGDAGILAVTQDGQLKVDITGKVLNQDRTLTAFVDLKDFKNYPVSAKFEFADADIGQYLGLIAPELARISGRATGSISLNGPLTDTDNIQTVARLTKLEIGGSVAAGREYTIRNQGDIEIVASPKEVRLKQVTFTGESTSVTLAGTLSRGENSNLTVNGELDLRLLSSYTKVISTTGIAHIQASITGTIGSPKITGSADLSDVGLRVVNFPIAMARGRGRIVFNADQARVDSFKASAPGGGTLTLSGGAALAGLIPDRWRLELQADEVGISYPLDTRTVFDGTVVWQGNAKYQVLSGDLHIRRASYTKDITLADLIATGGPFGSAYIETGPGSGGGGNSTPITLDIRIDGDNSITLRNNMADATGSIHLGLRGTIDDVLVGGRLILNRGTLRFRQDQYDITRGIITFPGGRNADPIFDLQTEADIRGYHIGVIFSGTIMKLHTTLKSDPQLPEGDIVSLITTGNLLGDRAGTAVAQTTTGAGFAQSILSASLSEQIERRTDRLFGLNRFSIDPLIQGRGTDPTARVTIGRQIDKNLAITYSQNLTSSGVSKLDRIVLIEYRLSNRFSLIGVGNDRGDLGFDVRIRKRF